jgi:hypothetical protein
MKQVPIHLLNQSELTSGGEIKGKGVENIAAMKQLIQYQTVPYNYSYMINIDVDIPILSISKGKTLFNDIFDISIISKSSTSDSIHFTHEDFIEMRNYFSFVKYNLSYSIENVKEFIENDFVNERKVNHITPETFDHWLTVARLMSLSFGEKNLSKDTWMRTKAMETERLKRFKN